MASQDTPDMSSIAFLDTGASPISFKWTESETEATPLEPDTKVYGKKGFELEYPFHHRDTGDVFGPDGFTLHGFNKQLVHKDTHTHLSPDGKTWAETERELVVQDFSKRPINALFNNNFNFHFDLIARRETKYKKAEAEEEVEAEAEEETEVSKEE
jgi:hypothetical protein